MSFSDGQTSATYTVTIYDDTVPEEAEVFFMSLISNSRDVYTQSPDTAKVTIEESDSECCANTLYLCEHNQSIPIDYTLLVTPRSGVMHKGYRLGLH